jgi:hypothetical protein
MQRREFMELLAVGTGALFAGGASAKENANPPADKKLVGMYIHQGWVYGHPYACRTWTDEDWRGYLQGLSRLGYNLVTIWPLLETMPNPLTPSDQAKLEQQRRVIDMAHKEFGMKVWITLCPNFVSIDDYARRTTFESRAHYGASRRINPADSRAMDDMMVRRETLLKPLAKMDGLVIIDSDPGGYPNSTNREFVDLLMRHRRLLDRLRPGGIELIYWTWVGWQSYGRLLATGDFAWGTEQEFVDTLSMLKERNPEPWGIAGSLGHARKLGLQSKVINFNYGCIEAEPNFPMTNFGVHTCGDPYQSGRDQAPRGAQANAQTHCLQLPGTFAFAQGARGLSLADKDYLRFADDLIPGQGQRILAAWQALGGMERERLVHSAAALAPLVKAKLESGPLKGLLLGDANRFVMDLYTMLRLKTACMDFMKAAERNQPLSQPLAEFVSWLDRWHTVTGYDGWWCWRATGDVEGADINRSLLKLNSRRLADFFSGPLLDYLKNGPGKPVDRYDARYYRNETETLRLVRILKQICWEMDPKAFP